MSPNTRSPLTTLSSIGSARGLDDTSGGTSAVGSDDSGGVLDSIKSGASSVLDLFSDVKQSDIAAGKVDLSSLSREDRIELLVDGSTSSLFGGSPWSVGLQLDSSVAAAIHAQNGGTLGFGITSGVLTDLESKLRTVRYALVWDDAIVSERGNLDLSVLQTFLVVALGNEPTGKVLTLWVTDSDLHVTLVKQGAAADINNIRTALIGEVGAAAPGVGNPISDAFNKVTGFITATQIGGLVALAAVGVVLVVIVRSNAASELAKNVKVIA